MLQTIQLSSEADHVLLLRNRRAGSGTHASRIETMAQLLRRRGLLCEECPDFACLRQRVAELREQRVLRSVVAAGGDGTVEAVANCVPAATPICIFPMGTENLLSKYLQIAADPSAIAESILDGHVVQLDAGVLRLAGATERLFLLMFGCGLDADIVHRLHETRHGHINHFSYAKPIFDSLRTYNYPLVQIRGYGAQDDQRITVRSEAHFAFVFNAPPYAIGLGICPDACPYDGQLDLVTFHGGSVWHGLMHLAAIAIGRHRSMEGVTFARARRFEIEAEGPVPFQVDGEAAGHLPASIGVAANRLHFVVSSRWISEQQRTWTRQRTPGQSEP